MNNFILSSSTLVGTDVKNTKGENLGTVKDVAIDLESGKVAYLVLAFGGFLGIGDKYFAIPLQSFVTDPVDEKLVLDLEKERLQDAPGFDRDNMPDHPQIEFLDEVYNFYGYGKYLKDQIKEGEGRYQTSHVEDHHVSVSRNERSSYNEGFRTKSEDINTRNRNFDPDINNSLF